jgi:hypothetical protein
VPVGTDPQLAQLTLAPAALPEGQVGAPYTYDFKPLLSAVGLNPATAQFSLLSGVLPAGLTLSADGRLAGLPQASVPVSMLEVQAALGATGVSQTYTFKVWPRVDIALAGATLPPAFANAAYAFDFKPLLALTGGMGPVAPQAVAWSADGALPAGLTFAAGVVSGAPPAGPYVQTSVTVTAAYQDKSASQTYTLALAHQIKSFGAYRAWDDGTFAADCKGYRAPSDALHIYAGATGDGTYRIQPAGLAPFDVRCDQTTDGGGWTVFQRRFDGSVDFYQSHAAYVAGFGTVTGEYWLGLEKTRVMSAGGRELRVDLRKPTGETGYEQYSGFSLSDAPVYALNLGPVKAGTLGDSMRPHVGFGFSTYDQGYDVSSTWTPPGTYCAQGVHGAWWYSNCYSSNLNGAWVPYGSGDSTGGSWGVTWSAWAPTYHYSLSGTEMKMR